MVLAMIAGYARVSTDEQNTDLQQRALEAAGCTEIAQEVGSGKSMSRPALDELLGRLVKGDTLVVWKLDRLGRTSVGLLSLMADLDKRGIFFKSVTESFDTATPWGRMAMTIMAAVAQLEREVLVERITAGMASAKRRGVKIGRPGTIDMDELRRMVDAGQTIKEMAATLGVTEGGVSKAKRRLK